MASGIGRGQPGRFNFDVVQNHWRQNHARYSHEPFPDNQRKQRKPDRILDPVSNDFAVQKIFELMEHDQEDERRDRNPRRNGKGNPDDDRIADQVAHNGQQSAEKRQADDERCVLE